MNSVFPNGKDDHDMTAIEEMASRAKAAAAVLRTVSPALRADALNRMAGKLADCREAVLAANAEDMKEAANLSASFFCALSANNPFFLVIRILIFK